MRALTSYEDRPFGAPLARHIVVELAGTPVAKGRPRFGKGHAFTPKRTRDYEADLQYAAKLAMHGRRPIEGALKVEILAAFPVPQSWPKMKQARAYAGTLRPTGRPDADNVLKIAGDALNGIVWGDDSQIVLVTIAKRYSDRPRLRIEVERLFTGEP